MSLYLLKAIAKAISMLVVSVLSLFGISFNSDDLVVVDNQSYDKTLGVVNTVVPYETIYISDSSIPTGVSKVLQHGSDGLEYTVSDGSKKVLKQVIDEKILKGTGKAGEYNGIITAYGPDCHTCSGRGFVACHTRERTSFNLITDGLYYKDSEFGELRVLAAPLSEFPCGTVVYVENSILEPFYGVVLDTGWGMNNSLSKGFIHFDVAFTTEKDAMVPKVTNMKNNIKYTVQRWGW